MGITNELNLTLVPGFKLSKDLGNYLQADKLQNNVDIQVRHKNKFIQVDANLHFS